MKYFLQNDVASDGSMEHEPREVIELFESGKIDGNALVAAKGDSGWQRLEVILPLLCQDAGDTDSGPFHAGGIPGQIWRPGTGPPA
jgi:hypothetical protein